MQIHDTVSVIFSSSIIYYNAIPNFESCVADLIVVLLSHIWVGNPELYLFWACQKTYLSNWNFETYDRKFVVNVSELLKGIIFILFTKFAEFVE